MHFFATGQAFARPAMVLRRLIAIVAFAPVVASAAPRTIRLEMRPAPTPYDVVECHDSTRETESVVIDLHRNRIVDVVETGRRSVIHAVEWQQQYGCIIETECPSETKVTEWSTRWRGRWSRVRDTLTLDLSVTHDECTATTRHDGFDSGGEGPPGSAPPGRDPLDCPKASERTRLTCVRDADVWRCTGRGLGLSKTPWVLVDSPPPDRHPQ